MKTSRFDIVRENVLSLVLDETEMLKIWKNEIRGNFRRSVIQDLHDYRDYHSKISNHISDLKARVLNGSYRVKQPLWFKEEKKLGASRLMVLPTPDDALLFQTITNKLSKDLKDIQPVSNVYFSQLRHQPKPRINEVYKESGYTRSQLYKKYVTHTLGFAKTGKLIVNTDISNFFDSIHLSDLRHVVSQWFTHHEVELDLLFRMINGLNFCPDYLPSRIKALPTIDLDAPRLLAHVYLFEMDQIMNKLTKGKYTRWMDDIVFAVDSFAEGKEILGKLNDVLRSRGLALNLQKTDILKPHGYIQSVMANENLYLDDFFKKTETRKLKKNEKDKFNKKLKSFLAIQNKQKSWPKVLKRYVGACKTSQLFLLDDQISNLFFDSPSIRDGICGYISKRGFDAGIVVEVKKILNSPHLTEDSALIHLTDAITSWDIPLQSDGRAFVKYMLNKLSSFNSDVGRYCHIYFGSAYCSRHELFVILKRNISHVSGDSFYARQILSCLPLVWSEDNEEIELILKNIAFDRPGSNSRLASELLNNLSSEFNFSDVTKYIFHNLKGGKLKHSKLLVLVSCVAGPESDLKNTLLLRVLEELKNTSQLEIVFRSIE